MNQALDRQDANGSVDPLAKSFVDELRKSGSRAWRLGFSTAEEREKFAAEKAELDFQLNKERVAADERSHEALKEGARRIIRGGTDYE